MQGSRSWLSDLQQLLVHGDEAVLVTAARTEGSTPREAGVKMIVARDRTFHTIGGGPLEWHAVDIARQLLRRGNTVETASPAAPPAENLWPPRAAMVSINRQLERLAIGEPPSGAMTLAFERLSIGDLGWVTALAKRYASGHATVRSVSFADDSQVMLSDPASPKAYGDCLLWDAGPLLTETIVLEQFPVTVFGAGHLGSALIRILGTLPCQVTWVDDRPQQLGMASSAELPANVTIVHSENPPEWVDRAPAASNFVVITHSAVLDEAIAERILLRGDYRYFGVIGSIPRRLSLEQRFAALGFDPTQVARMACPLGIPGVRDTAPEIVAISVAAQLLEAREYAWAAARPLT